MGNGKLLNNLQFRVMLLFLAAALVPLGMVGLLSISTAEELIISTVSSQLENVADDKADLLERWISERESDLQVVAGSAILKTMDPENISPYIKLVREKYKVYNGFAVVSRQGEPVFSDISGALEPGRSECIEQSLAGETYMSGMRLDPEGRESVFSISAPVFGEGGMVIGALCADVGTGAILSMVLKVSLGLTGECYLVDRNGTFLAHKEPGRILTENIAQSESFKNIFGADRSKKIYVDYRGIEVLGESRAIKNTGWFLVVEQDRDEAFKSADRLKRYVYVMTAVTMLGAVFLAWLLSYYVVKPVRNLSLAADALAAGTFDEGLLRTSRKDEIGALNRAFQDMARKLEARRSVLEEKVDMARAELEETDLILKKTQIAAERSHQLAALGRLAAGVTHEIRTPITSLKLFLESIQPEIFASPEQEQDFKIAMDQIKRMEATINRFLDFARPQEPVFSDIDVKSLIDEALLVVKPRANQQETAVDVIIDGELKPIRGDKKLLGEALLNLMVNSLEATVTKGELRIRAYMDRCMKDGLEIECVRIDVSDTGPGISPENLPSIFEPFFTSKASGTGLGLSIVYSTVAGHGGDIKVKSEPGRGAAFSVFLPLNPERHLKDNGKDPDS